MRVRSCLAVIAAAVVTMTLGGCSGSTPAPGTSAGSTASVTTTTSAAAVGLETLSGDEILAKAKAALLNAKSYRVTSTVTFLGITAVNDVIYVGNNAKGTQVAFGQTNEYIKIGDVLYVKATEAYWESRVRLEQLAQVTRRWVKVSATSPSHVSDIPRVEDMVTTGSGTVTAGPNTINGKPVVTVKSADGKSSAHVAAQGEPYLLRAEGVTSTDGGPLTAVFDFSEFGAITATIEAPTGEILDLT